MARPNPNKAQHWVPKSYLSAWTDPQAPTGHTPYVHLFSKDGSTHEKKAPHNIFTETDLYTIRRPDGVRDLRLEQGLSGLEQEFARIRREYLEPRRVVPHIVYVKLIAFLAAMHARTPAMRDHHQEQWQDVLKTMDQLEARMKTATPEQKKRAAFTLSPKGKKGLSHDDVRKIVANPMQSILGPLISAESNLLIQMMKGFVLTTTSIPGFITSDIPAIWVDPEAYKRPPLYRTPALVYESLEITMPISPRQMLLLGRGAPGITYVDVPDAVVAELNRRTRGHCDNQFVVSRDYVDPYWLHLGTSPDVSNEA
jgi:hypothetical protein